MTERELKIGNVVMCYRKPHHKIMTAHTIKSLFISDDDGKYYAELEDGFIINIDTGIVGYKLHHNFLRGKFKYKLIRDLKYPQIETRSYEIEKNVFLLDWYDVGAKKETYILQIGLVAIDCCGIYYLHELQNIYESIFKKPLP